MIDPRDVDKIPDEEWEEFKKRALKDELFYNGPGDLLDTPEGRARFCRLNVSGAFNKDDHSCTADSIDVNRTCASPDCCDETECATFKAKD